MLDSVSQQHATTTPPVAALPASVEMQPFSKRQQLMQELVGNSELLLKNHLEVRHLMTRNVVVISPSMTSEEMSDLMKERRIRHLLVCGRNGDLLGVVSDRDLHVTRSVTAQQVMSLSPSVCDPDTPLAAAITFLTNENISCLPVVSNGHLCGIITTTDLILALQCTLQLWPRLAQVLQHDPTWLLELEKIATSLNDELTATGLAERITAARWVIHQEIQNLINVVDLRADALTGMSNRHDLEEVLNMLQAVRKRYDRPFTLVLVTIDHFHRIRESCGDAVIKPLLKSVARLIESKIRASDFVARLRDDAFAVVLTETQLTTANTFCSRLQEDARESDKLEINPRITVRAIEAAKDDDVASLLSRVETAPAG